MSGAACDTYLSSMSAWLDLPDDVLWIRAAALVLERGGALPAAIQAADRLVVASRRRREGSAPGHAARESRLADVLARSPDRCS